MRKGIWRWEREYEDEEGNMKMRKGIWRWEREYAEKGVDKKVSSICKTTGQFGHSRSKVSNFNTRRYFSKTENICRSIDRTPTRDFNQVQPNILDQNLLALTSPSDVETNISYIVNWTGNTDNFNLHWHEQVRNLKKRKRRENWNLPPPVGWTAGQSGQVHTALQHLQP